MATLLSASLLGACSTIGSRVDAVFAKRTDDVREIAPNTFELEKRGTVIERSGSDLRLQLFDRGLAFCQARGRGFSVLDDTAQDASDGDQNTTGTFAFAIIHFNCL